MLGRPAANILSKNRPRHFTLPLRQCRYAARSHHSLIATSKRRPSIVYRSTSPLKPYPQLRGIRYLGREWTWLELWRFRWRNEPYYMSFAAAIIAVVFASSAALWTRYNIPIDYGPYPKKVGKRLRSAIYYTKVAPDPEMAVKLYLEALQAATEEGLSPLSDEVIGIKVELSLCLEATGNPKNAITILEGVKKDSLKWIEEHGKEPGSAGRRTKLLSWACRVSTRLADLYANKYVGNEEKMEESLVWAVETTLRERQRRETEGLKEGEGDWLDNDEFGSQLEDLAHLYLKQNKQFFASQLFLNALMVKPEKDCHAVTLMNNLATTIVQQAPPVEPGTPPSSPAQLRENGRSWARQAIALAGKIEPPIRNDECDRGCVAATHNLGQFAEMDGNIAEARQRYVEAGSIAHAIGFEEGVDEADAALKRLGGVGKSFKGSGWW